MKSRLLNLLANRKFLLYSTPILLVVVLAIFLPHTVFASDTITAIVAKIIGIVAYAWVWVLGKILVILINLVIWVASYNEFITAPAIINGWGIVRDVCNMFFILILLVIAFATTLNRESYAMKALLPKFIIAAILINFSKLICGVIIDFAQVIMLTFVNGFRDIGGGNLASMLGITKLLSMKNNGSCGEVNDWSVMGTFIVAVLYVIIATVVVLVILFMLVMRMIMIWVYVVLSPMAWLLSVLPATQKYSSQWWKQFAETVATGPILAFFIWLSFASVQLDSAGKPLGNTPKPSAGTNEQSYTEQFLGDTPQDECVALSNAGSTDSILKFIISIGMLMGGLIITKQIGGVVGGVAGSGLSKIQDAAKSARKWGTNRAKDTAKFAGRQAVGVAGLTMKGTGSALSKISGGRIGGSLKQGGEVMSKWHGNLKETVAENKAKKRLARLDKLGFKGSGMKALDEWQKDSALGKITASALTGSPQDIAMMPIAGVGKWMGGKMKNMAFSHQHNKNEANAKQDLDDTEQLVNDKLNNMSDAYKKMHAEKKKYSREEQLKEQLKWGEDYERETDSAGTPEEKKAVNDKYDKKWEEIENKYKKGNDDAKNLYAVTVSPEEYKRDNDNAKELEIAETYHDKAKDYYNNAKEANKYKDKKGNVKAENERYKKELETIQKEKDKEFKQAEIKFGGSSFALQGEKERIKAAYAPEEDKIHDNHKKKLSEIDNNYKARELDPSQLGLVGKALRSVGQSMQSYDPTKLTGAALKKGTEEESIAKAIVNAFKSSKIREFDTTDFSAAKGVNSKHEKVFSELANKSKNSLESIQALVNQLKTINAAGGAKKNSPEANVIDSLKKGLAHYLKKKPEDKSSFRDIIYELDKLSTGNEKIKIEHFTPKD